MLTEPEVPSPNEPHREPSTEPTVIKPAANQDPPRVRIPASGAAPQLENSSRYSLLEVLGEGGMGQVWLAEQREPVRRKVAIKVIRPGLDSAAVLARFEAERQALALMDHPHIARVMDGGLTEDGRPYFVMEFVRGSSLVDYCDRQRLGVRERLELFELVCQAVQHAHQKGIIHRDLKPGNILVAEQDGKPVPKVIDFGLAKAVASSRLLSDHTLHTAIGAAVGTPMYMSPEQVGRSDANIDTRSDIYSLGIILYELLTGSTPLQRDRMKDALWEEVRRLICDEDTPSPSSRLSTTDALPSIAAGRRTTPQQLSRLVKGDLDWIALKALDKDRNRRYATANDFARDIQRYLNDEVVEACPPSTSYRVRKFVRRYRGQVLAAVAVSLALVAGIIGTSLGMYQAETRRKEAEAAREVARDEKNKADKLAASEKDARERAIRVLQFFQDKVFTAAQPAGTAGGLGRDVTLAAAIAAAIPAIDTSFPNDPLTEASVRQSIATAYFYLGDYQLAADQYRKAVDLRQKILGPKDPEMLQSRADYAAAIFWLPGRLEESLDINEEVFRSRVEVLGPEHRSTIETVINLSESLRILGKDQVRLKSLVREYATLAEKSLGKQDENTLYLKVQLSRLLDGENCYSEAFAVLNHAVPWQTPEELTGSPGELWVLSQLALVCRSLGDSTTEGQITKTTLDLAIKNLGPIHSISIDCREKYIAILSRTDVRAALAEQDRLIVDLQSGGGIAAQSLPFNHANRAELLLKSGEADAAKQVAKSHISEFKQRSSRTEADMATWKVLCSILLQTGDLEAGTAEIAELLDAEKKLYGADGLERCSHLNTFAEMQIKAKQYSVAEGYYRESLRIREIKVPGEWLLANSQSLLGGCLLLQGKHADAEPRLRAAHEGFLKNRDKLPQPIGTTRLLQHYDRMIQLLNETNRAEEAAKLTEEKKVIEASIAPPASP